MSEQLPTPRPPAFRILVTAAHQTQAKAVLDQLPELGIGSGVDLIVRSLYFVEGQLSAQELEKIISLVSDPVSEEAQCYDITTGRVIAFTAASRELHRVPSGLAGVIEVALRQGVTDNVAGELLLAAHQSGIQTLKAAATGQRYEFYGSLSSSDLDAIARNLLVNSTIQRYANQLQPEFVHAAHTTASVDVIGLGGLSPQELQILSQQRRLALDVDEMTAVQTYFSGQQRDPTDAELETVAQTWSEHCVHKTFKALIEVHDPHAPPGENLIDGLLNTYLRAATQTIAAPWVRSAFVDNAGVIQFDDDHDLSFKVETHNHPSAVDPFGGANTGVGGVVRDVLGVSHRPIANTDVLCFGPAGLPFSELPQGVLHPRRIRSGVVAGVEDYGNKLGLATVNGAVLYHPGYTANPLVFCGCVGLGPRNAHPHDPLPGDRVIVIGGRTGRDGLRGATFSSLGMDALTGEIAGSSVQIGDPITEKCVVEVVVEARDAHLYHAVTDCGAGGLSSAVGEMSASLGVRVDLEKVPLKYAGLAPWEIWLSEAQERMVLAVPPQNLEALAALCQTYRVEWSDIGYFTPSGRLQVFYHGKPLVDLDNQFLHHGIPRQSLVAELTATAPTGAGLSSGGMAEPETAALPVTPKDLLLALLAHPNIASKEQIIRVYDHEVRGGTLIKPLTGPQCDGPSDAVVIKPLETPGWRGFVLANGVNPFIGESDPYAMAVSGVDEAVRNAVAVGADPDRLAILDNFCWGDPRRPETLGSLVQAARGCYDAALHYRTPFISGKDSLNNEYLGADGKRHAIPGTLLISSIAIHPDVRRAVSMDLKAASNRLYLVGAWRAALAGSHAAHIAPQAFKGASELARAPGFSTEAPTTYRRLHTAIHTGLVRAAHDLSEGGLAVAAAEMCLAGRLGLALEIGGLHSDPAVALFAETNGCLLVEVAADDAGAFEALLAEPGLEGEPSDAASRAPCMALGHVLSEPHLRIRHAGQRVLDLRVADLLQAFKTTGI